MPVHEVGALLSPAQERDAFRRLERGDRAARDLLILSNLRLVVSIARRYASDAMPLADLVQEGTLGLMRAVDKFDRRLGYRFSTYATWWIRHAVQRAVANKAAAIRLPVGRQRGNGPRVVASLDQPVGWGDPTPIGTLRPEEAPGPEELLIADVERTEARRALSVALARLPERDRAVLALRFGLGGGDPMTLAAVGRAIGLSRERVRQLEGSALERLAHERAIRALRTAA